MKKRCLSFFLCVILAISFSGCKSNTNDTTANDTTAQTTTSAPEETTTSAQATQSADAEKAGDYFPILENVRYVYQGEGNEFLSYDQYVDYTDDTHMQLRINNGGTETVKVIEVADGKVKCVFSQAETYYRENFLSKTGGTEEVLLMEPIEAGTSWTLSDGGTRTITGVDVDIETPSGTYSAISVETDEPSGTVTDYYAKGVGLVKTVRAANGSEMTSSLSEIQEDVPFTQTVRFFYPNASDEKIYYQDRTIRFQTNDITRTVLQNAYEEEIPGQPGTVFSDDTTVNSLYLSHDGMVYLDLSRSFLTGMNAGAEYEIMILQCVADTFGYYYGTDKVILTIDGELYESGHIKMEKGGALSVQTEGAVEIA